MLRVKASSLVYFIVVCFALLQVLSPFIHAHLDTEHGSQNTGFHVGNLHEEKAIGHANADNNFLSATPHATHTVFVAAGIQQDTDSAFSIAENLLVLFSLCFPLVLTPVFKQFFFLSLTPPQPLKRRLPAPRAPPQI